MPTVLIIELCETEIKVLQLSRNKKESLCMDHAFAVSMGDLENDEQGCVARGARLREKLKEKKIQAKLNGLVIPKHHSIVRLANLPTADLDEIEQMAQFQAEEYIPFNADRHVISHATLDRDPVNGSNVLICAVDGPMMARSLMLTREAKIEPTVADVSSVCLTKCLQYFEPAVKEEESTLILNIGRSHTDLSVMKKGMLVATRSHTLGIERLNRDMERATISETEDMEPQDIASNSIREWIEKIIRFTRQSYEVAVREHGVTSINRLYISGEGSTLNGLPQALGRALSVDIIQFNPVGTIDRSDNGSFQEDAIPGMNILLGLGLDILDREEGITKKAGYINLLPDEVIEEQEASAKRVLLLISGTMLFVTMLMLYLVFDRQGAYQKLLETQVKSYNKELAPIIERMGEMTERIDIIQNVAADRTPALVILDKISTFAAIGAKTEGGRLTLTEFRYTSGGDVTIAGTALEPKDIGDFKKFLETMSHEGELIFASIPPPSQSPDDLRNRGTIWTFSIVARLNQGGDQS